MRRLSVFGLFGLMLCLASAAVDRTAGLLTALFDAAFKPEPFRYRDLDPTPRSIFETRRMGLA